MVCGSIDPVQNRKEIDKAIVDFWSSKMSLTKDEIIKMFFEQRYHRFDEEYKRFINL